MKRRSMLGRMVAAYFVAFAAMSVFAAKPQISNVMAKQRFPWNGLVDIDYEITGDASEYNLEVSVFNVTSSETLSPTNFLSALPVSEGRHRITWSTAADGLEIVSKCIFTLSLVKPDVPIAGTTQYYVVDLSGGPEAESYPFESRMAKGIEIWGDDYKKTKLVLRRIDPIGEGLVPTRSVKITKPFFIGVFEVTQKQYELVMGENPSDTADKGDMRPVSRVSYNKIRGENLGSTWPGSSQVDDKSFLGKLRARTGLDFDIPTEAQWEYACRAETTNSFNNGGSEIADLEVLGRYAGNWEDGRGGFQRATVVGSYKPNYWGLYDMHGNIREWCRDWNQYGGSLSGNGDDPVGPSSGSKRILRSGSFQSQQASDCTSSKGYSQEPQTGGVNDGFRLVCSPGK